MNKIVLASGDVHIIKSRLYRPKPLLMVGVVVVYAGELRSGFLKTKKLSKTVFGAQRMNYINGIKKISISFPLVVNWQYLYNILYILLNYYLYKRHSLELVSGRVRIRDWYPATIYNSSLDPVQVLIRDVAEEFGISPQIPSGLRRMASIPSWKNNVPLERSKGKPAADGFTEQGNAKQVGVFSDNCGDVESLDIYLHIRMYSTSLFVPFVLELFLRITRCIAPTAPNVHNIIRFCVLFPT
ncbi:hypothetical protein QTP88_005929 [Uroleucon formosanum]